MRRIARQRDFVDAFPNSNAFFGGLQARRLFGQVHAAAFQGFGLAVCQAGSEVHHRIVADRYRGAPQTGAWFILIHAALLTG